MQIIISSFEVLAGYGATKIYTSLAVKTISRCFRCLRDAIERQIKVVSRSIGGTESNVNGIAISRLKFVDQQLRQQKLDQKFGMVDQQIGGRKEGFLKAVCRFCVHGCLSIFFTREGLKTLGVALSDSLEELALTNCDVIKEQNGFLVELAQNLKNIKILDLSYNHTLLDKEFASMITSYCNLQKLKLRGCSRLTNVSLISLCKNCKRLESVDMLYCHGIQMEGVEFMILNSRELRSLQVEDRKLSETARRWMTDKFIEVQH